MSNEGLAVVTGASSGIGRELAKCCAADGYDLIVAANEEMADVVDELRALGAANVTPVVADLGGVEGNDTLMQAIGGRPVAVLIANAGIGAGDGFLDQDLDRAIGVVELNVVGTMCQVHAIGRRMREAKGGRILITGSIAGFIPGAYQAVYNGSKAFLDSFSYALREELKDTGVSVTCLMPGVTDTAFFERAGMLDTDVGRSDSKADPASVARDGYDAMMRGEAGVVSGLMNKIQTVFAGIIPDTVLAKMHRRMAEPDRPH